MTRLLTIFLLLAASTLATPAQAQSVAFAGIAGGISWAQTDANPSDNFVPSFTFTSTQSTTDVRYFANLNAAPQEVAGSAPGWLYTPLSVKDNVGSAFSDTTRNATSSLANAGLVYSSATTTVSFVASNGDLNLWMPLNAAAFPTAGGWAHANVTVSGVVFAGGQMIPLSYSLDATNGMSAENEHNLFSILPNSSAYGYLNIVSQTWASAPTPVPEPSQIGMLLAGVALLGLMRRARR